jgi:hypothetical protein
VDPSNSKEDDEVDVNDAVLQDGAAKAQSFGIEDDEPTDGDENKLKCWRYLNSMRDVLSDAAAVDAAAAVVEIDARSVSDIRVPSFLVRLVTAFGRTFGLANHARLRIH